MTESVQRSLLIVPTNVSRFVDKAHLRGADAVMLDLEDSVPLPEKPGARASVKDSIGLVGRGGADILVRVNNESSHLFEDLEAAVHPGVHAIFLPKVESGELVADVDRRVEELEKARGIATGEIKLSVHIESPKGILRSETIATASRRIESMSLGPDDYCVELGVAPSRDGSELLFALQMMVTVCKTCDINPLGIVGTVGDFSDLEAFGQAADRARQLGFTGAYCIHPDQVGVLNRVFSPSPEQITEAHRMVEAFEAGLERGRASVNLDGRMVDTPIYKQAVGTLDRAEAVTRKEERKAAALAVLA
jgi:citrate lyase subunit beta/citryl-CoA lyase